jgi:NADPH:quinone reductase-like Zn-dependent oxidoreductase
VRAIGLNRSEATFRSGRVLIRPRLPTQLGLEAAGEIEAVGPGVEGFAPGERVSVIPAFGVTDYGLYGEVALAPARALTKMPDSQIWEEGAATWSAFGAAWCGLIDMAKLSAGQVVLITAASSSVGLAAIQVARMVGAVPIALTRTSAKAEALRGAGAAHVIATQEASIPAGVMELTQGRGAQVLFDAVAGPDFAQLAQAAAPGAIALVYGALSPEPAALPILGLIARQLTIRGFALNLAVQDRAKMDAMKRFVGEGLASGALRPTISRTFAFDEIVEAHRYLEAGDQLGKIVVAA